MSGNNGLKMNSLKQRLQGSLPKIGIRPVIDGRRKGVRESLEKQTMQMANNATSFLEKNLKSPLMN